MYSILFNGNLLIDDKGRPYHFDKKKDAEEKAAEVRKVNSRFEVKIVERKIPATNGK